VLFLGKASAQLFGNYSKLEYNFPEIALQCLTGRGGDGKGLQGLGTCKGVTGGNGAVRMTCSKTEQYIEKTGEERMWVRFRA
jgi:hypothetical protein